MPSRRTFLSALSAFSLSAGGCLGSDKSLSPGDVYDTSDGSLRVSNPRVRHGILIAGVAHVDPHWEDGAQFLVVDVAVEGDGPPASTRPFVVETNVTTVETHSLVYSSRDDDRIQQLGFPIPTDPELTAVSLRLRDVPGASWQFSDDTVEALRTAPDFAVQSFEVPAAAPSDAPIEVALSVQNTGDRAGRFLAELGESALSDQGEIEIPVAPGQTKMTTHSVEPIFVEENHAEIVLRWEGGVEQRTVRIV